MNMGGATEMTAAHTVHSCRLPATLDMAAPNIWSCYHHRLPVTSGKIMLAESRVFAQLTCANVRLSIGGETERILMGFCR